MQVFSPHFAKKKVWIIKHPNLKHLNASLFFLMSKVFSMDSMYFVELSYFTILWNSWIPQPSLYCLPEQSIPFQPEGQTQIQLWRFTVPPFWHFKGHSKEKESSIRRTNRPFYRYGGHIELIWFKECYRMLRRHEHISFVFSSAFRDIFSERFLRIWL